jgi:hypothetical protein
MMDDSVAGHGGDTSGKRSGIKGRDSGAITMRLSVADAIFRRMREASCQGIGNLQMHSRIEYVRPDCQPHLPENGFDVFKPISG